MMVEKSWAWNMNAWCSTATANEGVIDREQSMCHKDAEKLIDVPTFSLEQIRNPLHWII